MKLFIKKFIIFNILLLFILNLLLFYTASENRFISAILFKHSLLEKEVDLNRIIIVGGSNVNMSIDSALLSEETGRFTVNMGLFAQFGLRYQIEEIKSELRKGDIVLIIPEYHQFYYFFDGWRGLNELIFVYPQSISHIKSINQFRTLISTYPRFLTKKMHVLPKYLKSKIKRKGKTAYLRLYNAHGDYIAHLDDNTEHHFHKTLFNHSLKTDNFSFQNDSIQCLNSFHKECKQKDITVYFCFPTIPKIVYNKNKRIINEVRNKLSNRINIPIINCPNAEARPINEFYNTIYHLNSIGRNKRTLRLIEDLKKAETDNL